jgi:ADP-ribose pyrophosphatase
MEFAVVRSEVVYHGPIFDIRQDHLRLPNGSLAKIDVVDHRGAVTMIPVDSQGQIWFIRQYRHAIRKVLLELPAGAAEIGETPLTSAQRELREETGMAAGNLQEIGSWRPGIRVNSCISSLPATCNLRRCRPMKMSTSR